MIQPTFEAIYENGALYPVTPLPLAERERVMVTLESTGERDWLDPDFGATWVAGAAASLTLDDVRTALAKIQGSMDAAIDEQRGAY